MIKKHIPKIRFQGFDDEWEEKKLKELGSTYSGLAGKTKDDFGKGSAKYITYKNIFSNPITNLEELDNIEIDEKQNTVEFGDVLFTVSSETPKEVGLSSVWLGNEKNIYINSFCFGYRPFKKINSYYLAFILRSNPIRKQFALLAQGISRYNISKGKAMELSIPIPSLPEQESIGQLFRTLDDLISAYKENLEHYQSLKNSMLSKMFPKEGQKQPEIRLDGFDEEWDLKKLSEVSGFRRGSFPQPYGNKEWYGGEAALPFVQVIDVGNNLKLVETTKQSISKKAQDFSVFVPMDSVIVTLQGSIGRVALTQYDSYVDRTILFFESYFVNINKVFWAYTIQKKFEIEKSRAPGGTIKTITKEVLSNFRILLPSLPEQEAIGAFFANLDETISSYQDKIGQLELLKKNLLSQMFI